MFQKGPIKRGHLLNWLLTNMTFAVRYQGKARIFPSSNFSIVSRIEPQPYQRDFSSPSYIYPETQNSVFWFTHAITKHSFLQSLYCKWTSTFTILFYLGSSEMKSVICLRDLLQAARNFSPSDHWSLMAVTTIVPWPCSWQLSPEPSSAPSLHAVSSQWSGSAL